MKKINLLVCTLAVAGLGFTSCSDDDNDANNDVRIEGTYLLDEVNTAKATDFNMDGVLHIDQMEESKCYDGSKVVLNADGTFTYVIKGILVSEGTAGCSEAFTASGLYKAETASNTKNSLITLTYTNQKGDQEVRVFTKIGDELIWEDNTILSSYPDRDANGAAILTQGRVQYVFDK